MVAIHYRSVNNRGYAYTRGVLGNKRVYAIKGSGFLDEVRKFGRFAKKQARTIGPSVLKALAPILISQVANKGALSLSNKGAPDSVVNTLSKAGQEASRLVQNSRTPELSGNQQLASDFLSANSQDLLQKLLARGSGGSHYSRGAGGSHYSRGSGGSHYSRGSGLDRLAPRLNPA